MTEDAALAGRRRGAAAGLSPDEIGKEPRTAVPRRTGATHGFQPMRRAPAPPSPADTNQAVALNEGERLTLRATSATPRAMGTRPHVLQATDPTPAAKDTTATIQPTDPGRLHRRGIRRRMEIAATAPTAPRRSQKFASTTRMVPDASSQGKESP